jgi:adenylate cyclase
MPIIHFEPDGKKIAASASETVLAAALRAGIPTAHPCGGDARCSICRVSVENGLEHCAPMTERERVLSEQLGFSPEVRLACQTTAAGDIKVRRLVVDEDDLELTQRLDQSSGPFSIGEEKELAILFADIRGFTEFSEKLPPYDVIYILNRYFYHMGKSSPPMMDRSRTTSVTG